MILLLSVLDRGKAASMLSAGFVVAGATTRPRAGGAPPFHARSAASSMAAPLPNGRRSRWIV